MNTKKIDKLEKAAIPLIKYMRKHCNPHHKIIVTIDGVELLLGEMGVSMEVED